MDQARFCQKCGQALVPAPERPSAWNRWRERYPRWLVPAIAVLFVLCVADVIIGALLWLLPAPQKGTIAVAVGPTPAYSTPTTTPTLLPTSTLTLTPTGVPPTRLSGQVIDKDTARPVEGARVVIGDREAITDQDGHFEVVGLPGGQYAILTTKDGYDPILSAIVSVGEGEAKNVDVALFPQGTASYPKDPMSTHQIDPNGAPTAEDAERLAREQGFSGKVVAAREVMLQGEYLVNYKVGEELRSAKIVLNHAAWELTDEKGQVWNIVRACGNLAMVVPAGMTIPAQCSGLTTASRGKIAFVSNRDGQFEIYLMNPDGSEQRRLTNTATLGEWAPDWSPDGTKLAFDAGIVGGYHYDDTREIWMMNADGSNLTRLTDNNVVDGDPSWSPDGSKIAFFSRRSGTDEIYVMNADGSNQTRLSYSGTYNLGPRWSPDGSKISYYFWVDNHWEIGVMSSDGSNRTRLTYGSANNSQPPSWSPDGTKLLFSSTRYGHQEIHVMNADGSNQTRLTSSGAEDWIPSWSPDGSQIVFDSSDGSQFDIYMMNADGSERRGLTHDDADDRFPRWQPSTGVGPTLKPTLTPTPTPTPTSAGVSQGEMVWSEPVKISNNISGSYIPSMAFDSNGNLHAVWEDWDARFGKTGVHYARWDGTSWSPQVDIPGSEYGLVPALAVDRNDNVHVVWNKIPPESPLLYGDIYYSRFDGTLWSEPIDLSNTGDKCYAPNIAVDGRNNLHVVWHHAEYPRYPIYHTTWSEAMGWAIPSLLLESSGSTSLPIAVDRSGKLHLAWCEKGTLFYSRLEGTILSSPVSLYAVQPEMPTIVVDSKGRVHIAWVELGPTVNNVVSTSIYYSVGEGGMWSPAIKISAEGGGFPAIAIDSLDRVHLVWQEGYYVQWDGTKWLPTQRIIDGNMPAIPAIAVDSKDNIHVLWSIGTGTRQKTKEDLFHMIGTIK